MKEPIFSARAFRRSGHAVEKLEQHKRFDKETIKTEKCKMPPSLPVFKSRSALSAVSLEKSSFSDEDSRTSLAKWHPGTSHTFLERNLFRRLGAINTGPHSSQLLNHYCSSSLIDSSSLSRKARVRFFKAIKKYHNEFGGKRELSRFMRSSSEPLIIITLHVRYDGSSSFFGLLYARRASFMKLHRN